MALIRCCRWLHLRFRLWFHLRFRLWFHLRFRLWLHHLILPLASSSDSAFGFISDSAIIALP
ncbi:MAG: hypothetical protein ACI4AW_08050 [Paludibacteraceae bacterium]